MSLGLNRPFKALMGHVSGDVQEQLGYMGV